MLASDLQRSAPTTTFSPSCGCSQQDSIGSVQLSKLVVLGWRNYIMTSDSAIVLDLLQGFRRSMVLFTACELGIFDFLSARPHGATSEETARALNTSLDGM